MDRDRIKIIDFDKVDAAAGATRAPHAADRSSAGIKIREFGGGPEARRPAATADVPAAAVPQARAIKIVEFDKQPAAAEPAATPRREAARAVVPAPGAIRIVDFDSAGSGKSARPGRRPGMKIVEFD